MTWCRDQSVDGKRSSQKKLFINVSGPPGSPAFRPGIAPSELFEITDLGDIVIIDLLLLLQARDGPVVKDEIDKRQGLVFPGKTNVVSD